MGYFNAPARIASREAPTLARPASAWRKDYAKTPALLNFASQNGAIAELEL
jgi:hypothetical protein